MKKILFAALAVLLPLFAACNKNNDNDNRFEDPRFIQYAGQLVPRDGVPVQAPARPGSKADAAPEAALQSIELTESEGVYTGNFAMPAQASSLVINTGSIGGDGGDDLDQG